MHHGKKRRGFTLLEVLVALFILGVVMYVVLPRGQHTKNNMNAETAAQTLMARLQQARQTSISKNVPVGVAIPTTAALYYSNTAYQLEGDVQPRITGSWKIEQEAYQVVYFVGNWATNSPWTPLATPTDFDIANWNQYPPGAPAAALFVFTPDGRIVSQNDGVAGNYTILVAQGLSANGKTLNQAATPWTVALAPTGEIQVVPGLLASSQAAQLGQGTDTPMGAVFAPPAAAANQAPTFQPLIALPSNRDPVNSSNDDINVGATLTLYANVTDQDGDPPFLTWSCSAVGYTPIGSPLGSTPTYSLDPATNGGAFGTFSDSRMDWSPENKCWMARTTWTPAVNDTVGGYYYQLQCSADDHQGGITTAGYPIRGGWLVTITTPWVLYRTLASNGYHELWRTNLQGNESHRVAAIPNQDILFAQWASAGDEALFGTTTGQVYRVQFDGSNLRQVGSAGGNIWGAALNPKGDTLYFYAGPNAGTKAHRTLQKISMVTGVETQAATSWFSNVNGQNGLSCALMPNGHDVLLQTFYHSVTNILGTKYYYGTQVVDVTDGTATADGSGGNWPPGLLRAMGRGGNRGGTDGGVYITPDGSQLWWGSVGGNQIGFASVNTAGYTNAPSFDSLLTPAPSSPLVIPGLVDTHSPQPVPNYLGKTGLIFVCGRDPGARLYFMPDIANPGVYQMIPLAAGQISADTPSVGPPR